jgi:hypothetical protein
MTDPEVRIVQTEVRIRRAPKVPVFLALGALFGAIVTLILTSAFPVDPTIGFPATVGYFMLYGIPAGAVLGALLALLLDRMSARRARNVTVEHTTVDPLPYDDEVDDEQPKEQPSED